MGHNGHGINLYGVLMIIMSNLHAEGHSDPGTLSPSTLVDQGIGCVGYILLLFYAI